MQSVSESKQELEASIRYAENAISSAKATIESMEFRQEMAKKQYAEQTGREAALERELEERISEVADLKVQIEGHRTNMALMTDELEKLRKEKEASSGPCGCQAYRDLEERATMPVIPKDVAIAIFREGIQTGVLSACSELEGQTIMVEESEYVGNFEVSFTKEIDLDDELDLNWMRDKCGDYSEDAVIDSLKGLCADNEFECRIHGVDDQEEKND